MASQQDDENSSPPPLARKSTGSVKNSSEERSSLAVSPTKGQSPPSSASNNLVVPLSILGTLGSRGSAINEGTLDLSPLHHPGTTATSLTPMRPQSVEVQLASLKEKRQRQQTATPPKDQSTEESQGQAGSVISPVKENSESTQKARPQPSLASQEKANRSGSFASGGGKNSGGSGGNFCIPTPPTCVSSTKPPPRNRPVGAAYASIFAPIVLIFMEKHSILESNSAGKGKDSSSSASSHVGPSGKSMTQQELAAFQKDLEQSLANAATKLYSELLTFTPTGTSGLKDVEFLLLNTNTLVNVLLLLCDSARSSVAKASIEALGQLVSVLGSSKLDPHFFTTTNTTQSGAVGTTLAQQQSLNVNPAVNPYIFDSLCETILAKLVTKGGSAGAKFLFDTCAFSIRQLIESIPPTRVFHAALSPYVTIHGVMNGPKTEKSKLLWGEALRQTFDQSLSILGDVTQGGTNQNTSSAITTISSPLDKTLDDETSKELMPSTPPKKEASTPIPVSNGLRRRSSLGRLFPSSLGSGGGMYPVSAVIPPTRDNVTKLLWVIDFLAHDASQEIRDLSKKLGSALGRLVEEFRNIGGPTGGVQTTTASGAVKTNASSGSTLVRDLEAHINTMFIDSRIHLEKAVQLCCSKELQLETPRTTQDARGENVQNATPHRGTPASGKAPPSLISGEQNSEQPQQVGLRRVPSSNSKTSSTAIEKEPTQKHPGTPRGAAVGNAGRVRKGPGSGDSPSTTPTEEKENNQTRKHHSNINGKPPVHSPWKNSTTTSSGSTAPQQTEAQSMTPKTPTKPTLTLTATPPSTDNRRPSGRPVPSLGPNSSVPAPSGKTGDGLEHTLPMSEMSPEQSASAQKSLPQMEASMEFQPPGSSGSFRPTDHSSSQGKKKPNATATEAKLQRKLSVEVCDAPSIPRLVSISNSETLSNDAFSPSSNANNSFATPESITPQNGSTGPKWANTTLSKEILEHGPFSRALILASEGNFKERAEAVDKLRAQLQEWKLQNRDMIKHAGSSGGNASSAPTSPQASTPAFIEKKTSLALCDAIALRCADTNSKVQLAAMSCIPTLIQCVLQECIDLTTPKWFSCLTTALGSSYAEVYSAAENSLKCITNACSRKDTKSLLVTIGTTAAAVRNPRAKIIILTLATSIVQRISRQRISNAIEGGAVAALPQADPAPRLMGKEGCDYLFEMCLKVWKSDDRPEVQRAVIEVFHALRDSNLLSIDEMIENEQLDGEDARADTNNVDGAAPGKQNVVPLRSRFQKVLGALMDADKS